MFLGYFLGLLLAVFILDLFRLRLVFRVVKEECLVLFLFFFG